MPRMKQAVLKVPKVDPYFLALPGEKFLDVMICPLYMVSNYGRVFSKTNQIILSPYIDDQGYQIVCIRYNNYKVHRLVMMAFNTIDFPENFQVNHIDGNKINNNLYNLEWCTNSENVLHAFRTGLAPIGEDHINAVITNEQAHQICKCLEQQLPYREICDIVGLDYDKTMKIISMIKCKESWTHISCQYNIVDYKVIKNKKFSDEEIHYVCNGLQNGLKTSEILNGLGIDFKEDKANYRRFSTSLDKIKARKSFREISDNYNF